MAITQAALSEFTLAVTFDENDDPVLADKVAGYERQDTYKSAIYRSPTRPATERIRGYEILRQQFVYVVVDKEAGGDRYLTQVFEGAECGSLVRGPVVLTADDEIDALETTLEWMDDHPAPTTFETIDRPGTGTPEEMDQRDIGDQVEAIREGTHLEVDNLAAKVVEAVEVENSPGKTPDLWECETAGGESFRLFVEDTTIKPTVAYTTPDSDQFREVVHLVSHNEANLRDDVDMDTYEWLKTREGEAAIRKTAEHNFQVVELEEVRDGAVNPSSGAVDPGSYSSGTYIDEEERGQWFGNVAELEAGSYRVIDRGVTPVDDPFGTSVAIDAETWDDVGPFGPTTTAPETVADIDAVAPSDRSGLSRDDDVSEITGVGDAIVGNFFSENIGELYDHGFPAPYIGSQYSQQVIADLYTVSECGPSVEDALRAVIGLLGGVGFEDGEKVGTAASGVSGTLALEEIDAAWLSEFARIKDEYVPGWLTTDRDDDGVNALGAGIFTAKEVAGHMAESPRVEMSSEEILERRVEVTDVLAHPTRNGVVALAGDDEYLEVPGKPIAVAATVATIGDLADEHARVSYLPVDDGGVVLLTSTRVPWSVAIDTSRTVDPTR